MFDNVIVYPEHALAIITEDTGLCGDAYCGGHNSSVIQCTCGYKEPFSSSNDDGSKKFRLMAVEHMLGRVTDLTDRRCTHITDSGKQCEGTGYIKMTGEGNVHEWKCTRPGHGIIAKKEKE